jgi:hypothetical protein
VLPHDLRRGADRAFLVRRLGARGLALNGSDGDGLLPRKLAGFAASRCRARRRCLDALRRTPLAGRVLPLQPGTLAHRRAGHGAARLLARVGDRLVQGPWERCDLGIRSGIRSAAARWPADRRTFLQQDGV